MVNRLRGMNGMDYSQGLPTPDGAGDLGSLIPEGKAAAVAGLIISSLALVGGIYVSVASYQKAPMPAAMRPLFRTNIDWYEPNVPLYTLGTVLEAGGVIGIIASISQLLRS